jgi:glycosyltransferase involved in cell wall biosynthesis
MAKADGGALVPLRVAIDGRYIQDRFPGIGRYTYNLIRALQAAAPEDEFLVLHDASAPSTHHDMAALAALPRVRVIDCAASPLALSSQWRLVPTLRRLAPDIFHTPHVVKPWSLPRRSVTTVHDLIPLTHPDSLPSRLQRLLFRQALRLTCWTSAAIIVPSEASRRDLVRRLSVPADRIHLVPHGVGERFQPQPAAEIARVRREYGLPARYVLQIGGNKPHKNLPRLVEAWADGDGRGPTHGDPAQAGLVLAGRQDPRFAEAHSRVRARGLRGSVLFIGEVAERDLPALYSGAELFVYPSLGEGFGLPVVEAMACGTPVVCSDVPALSEVAGHAAVLVNPTDVPGLGRAIRRLLGADRLREQLRQRGLARAQAFPWSTTAAGTCRVYREISGR